MGTVISSRTPEGEPTHCPVCGAREAVEPSLFGGDAPCPACGHLLWVHEPRIARRNPRTIRDHAEALLRSEPRRPMFGVAATLARQVGRVIRAARRSVLGRSAAQTSGVYDHWLDG